MNKKAQTIVELMILLSISILALSIIYSLYASQIDLTNSSKETSIAKSTINKLINSANTISLSGAGSTQKLLIEIPSGVSVIDSNISGKMIYFHLSNGSEVFGVSDVNIVGEFKKNNGVFVNGVYYVTLLFDGQKVIISYDDFELNTNGIFVSAKQGTTVSKLFTVRNNSSRTASFWVENNFSFSSFAQLNINENDISFTLAPNETRVIDLNIVLSKFSSGNYAGTISVIGEIDDGISDTNISKNVFVSVESFLEFEPVMIFPKSTSFSAQKGSFTIKSFSLCNSSESNASVSFTRDSNPDANMIDWFNWPILDTDGIAIDSVASGDCRYFDLNFVIPLSAVSNIYDANITITYNDGNTSSAYFFVNVSYTALPYNLFFSTSNNTLFANYFLSNNINQKTDANYFVATGELDWNSSDTGSELDSSNYLYDATLISLWHFNDKNSSGYLLNSISGVRDANLNSGADIDGVGLWDTNGLFLDGSDDGVIISDLSLSSTFTYSSWIYPISSSGEWGSLFAFDCDTGIYYKKDSRKISFYYSDDHLSNTALTESMWHHVVVTNNAGSVTFYIDGVADGTASSAPGFVANKIGNDSCIEPFNGYMDEVAVWNRVLSSTEVKVLYKSQSSAYDLNLVAYYKFNSKNSTTIYDSVRGNNGTLNGGADVNGVGMWDTNSGWFDGTTGYVLVNNYVHDGNSLTISAWINPNTLSGERGILTSNGFMFESNGDKLRLYSNIYAGVGANSTIALEVNKWNYVGVTFTNPGGLTNNLVTFYINGKRESVSLNNYLYGTTILRIGNYFVGNRFFGGLIDEVKVYNRVLSFSEFDADYNSFLSAKFADSNIVDASETADWNSVKVNKDINYSFGKEISISEKFGDGLVGLWHLNDKNSQGWVLNSKTNIRDGNLWNGADTNAFGLWDTNSGYFDGVNDYAIFDLNKTLTGTTFTFSLWVRPIGAQSTKGIFQVADGLTSINPWILLQRTTSTTTKWYVNGNYQITNTVNDNEWTHLALTFDGTIWRAYKNGIADGTYTGAIGANTGSNFWLGNGYNGYYNGNLEEVAVWDKALSATDINNLYKSQKGSWVDPNLIGYWKLNNKNSSGWVLNSALSYRDSNLWNGADTNGLGLWDTNAGYFDGVNDYVQTNPISLPTSTNFTFSIWVKPNFSSYQQPFIHWGSTASPRLYWRVESSGRMYADTGITSPKMYWNGNLFCSSTDCSGVTPTFANGAWYNLVFTGTYTGTALTNAPILIGSGNPTHPGRYFSGLMDEVKIYNRSLSATEIALDYNRVLSSKFVDSNIVDVSLTMNWDSVKVNSNEFYSFGKQLEDRNSGTSLTTQLTNSNSLFDSNLVGLWHLNDKNSNGWVLNSATNIRDGNLFNSANVNVSGLWDTNAGSFNGSSYVNIGDTFYTGDNITVSAWINSSTLTGVIVGKDASGAREYTLDLLNGYPRFYSDGTGAWGATSGTIISLNTWVHLVGTHNSSGLVNLYINGTLDKTVTSGVTIPNTSTSLRIGGRVYSGSEGYFTGKIEEVAIWDRVLSASEVTSLYKSQANFAEPNLVGLWHLNEASGTTTVADFSGNSNNGTNSVAKNGLTITTSGTDTIYTFKSSGTFTTTSDMNVKVLVVAGGGGGGSFGAGAGAGGLIYNAALPILAQTYSITVGNGGAGATTSNNGIAGLNGSNSIFSSLIAVGGGGGGTRQANMYSGAGASGGSGGGSSMGDSGPQANGGTATSGQGNNGGKGRIGTCPYAHGGGGGAGAVGADGSVSKSGDGGIGLSYDINGSNVYYAGGGGAGAYNGCGVETPGTGGLGGGGAGSASTVGVAGTANSGGGGGGGAHTIAGGAGGSGVVIIRVPTSSTQYITASDGLWNTNGLTLDGVDDYIDMTNSSQLSITGALTLSAWAYTGRDAVQSLMSRWNYGNATYCQYAFGLTPTKALYFYVGNGAGNIFTSTVTANNSFTLNAWHHFVAVYSPSTYMRIYIDGALVKEITASVPATNNNISRPLFIGADYPSNSWFGGKMDEVAIWNRALTATEVNELYRKGVSRLDLNIYSCSDVSCNTKTSSKYLENVNNNTLIDFNSSLASSRYLGFDAYFKKAKGLEDLNANSFYVGSFIKDVNFRYSAGALSLFARTSTNGYSWGDWSALSQSSPQTLSISDANFFQYKSLLSTSVTSVSPVLKDVNVTYTRISN